MTAADPEIFETTPDGYRLVGATCSSCGATTFPAQGSCPRCTGTTMERTHLPSAGTLWTFTVQGFAPKHPYLLHDQPFTPYGVGYIDLGPVLVEARLTVSDPARLRIGMPMELHVEQWATTAEGVPAYAYAFAPVEP